MPGRKPAPGEKSEIKRLLTEGFSIEEIQRKYPDIDGRSITGLKAQMKFLAPPGTDPPVPPGQDIPPPPDPAPPPEDAPEADAPVPSVAAPPAPRPAPVAARSRAPLTPQQYEAEARGFQMEQPGEAQGGFVSEYGQYFLIERLDGPSPGFCGMEHDPNFGATQMYQRYRPGRYKVHHYRNGRVFNTYPVNVTRPENITPMPPDPNRVVPEGIPTVPGDPSLPIIRAVETYHRFQHDAQRSASEAQAEAAKAASEARAAEAQVAAERERGKAAVETSATVGLVEVLKEQAKPKADPSVASLDKIIVMIQEEGRQRDKRHEQEMERLKEENKHTFELRVKELESERTRAKEELASREKDRMEFLAKMTEIEQKRDQLARELDSKRDEFHKASYERMMGEVKQMREAMDAELSVRRENAEELIKVQKEAAKDMIDLKKSINVASDGVKIAEIIGKGIEGLGSKLDKILPDKVQIPGGAVNPPGQPPQAPPPPPTDQDLVTSAKKEQWFQDLQDEIAQTVKMRLAAKDPATKPHGSMLATAFVDRMNRDSRLKIYVPWLCARYWADVLRDAGDGIKKEHMETFKTEEAAQWYDEYRSFLSACWNASLPK